MEIVCGTCGTVICTDNCAGVMHKCNGVKAGPIPVNQLSAVNPCALPLPECDCRSAIMEEIPMEERRRGRTHRQKRKWCKTG